MQVFITQDGTRFQYTCKGSGIPVILMHGFTEDGRVWEKCIETLRKNFKVLTPYLPTDHHGEFSVSFKNNPTIEKLADYIHELATHIFNNTPIHFIGHSMGGYIGLAYAETYPNKLKSLGLFHSTAFADSEEKKESRKKTIEFLQKNGTAALLKQAIPGLFADTFKFEHADTLTEMMNLYSSQTKENLICYLKAMISRKDRTEILRSIKALMLIVGKHDKAVPLAQSMELIQLAPAAQVLLLEESGHMGMFEEPNKSINFLEQFLTTHS